MWIGCHAEVIEYTNDGQQGRCMRPGAVGENLVDRLVEQAAEQWDMQDHPGWDIFDEAAACKAAPVGRLGSMVQLSFDVLRLLQLLRLLHSPPPPLKKRAH